MTMLFSSELNRGWDVHIISSNLIQEILLVAVLFIADIIHKPEEHVLR